MGDCEKNKTGSDQIWLLPVFCIFRRPYVGIIQIRFMGRRSYLPLSLCYKLPSYAVVASILHRTEGKIKTFCDIRPEPPLSYQGIRPKGFAR